MNKLLALVLAVVCVLGLGGCNDTQETKEDMAKKTHTLDVTENSVAEIGRGKLKLSVEISEEDANSLSAIVNNGSWIEEPTDCESDCVINLKGQWIYYHSNSGTLNKYDLSGVSYFSSKEQEIEGKSLVLSGEEQATVNNILQKYVTLGMESNLTE